MATMASDGPKIEHLNGQINADGLRVAIVASRFNGFLVESLIAGAVDALTRTGAPAESITVVRCPGAYEIPMVAKRCAASGRFDAIVCLGVVIRGATPHFDYVAGEASRGLALLQGEFGIPIGFGLLTFSFPLAAGVALEGTLPEVQARILEAARA